MGTSTTQKVGRKNWHNGPWDDEPDDVAWVDTDTGLACNATRNSFGAWCGYVGVPNTHPLCGMRYQSCANTSSCEDSYCEHSPAALLKVHGGVTFSARVKGFLDPKDSLWVFGFDCAHADDLTPGWSRLNSGYAIYCDLDYVREQCGELARQLKSMEES